MDSASTLPWYIEATTFRMVTVASVWCAQLYAQHMAHLLRSVVRLPLQVVVPVQQLTPTAPYKWMALTISDAMRVSADAAKLFGHLGRRGRWQRASLLLLRLLPYGFDELCQSAVKLTLG